MAVDQIHVGVDATTWINDRGFGRFTRELIGSLACREGRFRYTLLFDKELPDNVPGNVNFLCASTRRGLSESIAGTSSRSPTYIWSVNRAVRRSRFDVFFFPAVYSYFPLLTRTPCVVCYHDTTAERLPELLFPTTWNHKLWQLKTALSKWQMTRAMTVSRSSAEDLEKYLRISRDKIDLVTEAADPAFRVIDDLDLISSARIRHNIPPGSDLLVHIGGMNRHKNIMGLLRAMPAIIAKRPNTCLAIVGDTSGTGFWDNVPELKQFVDAHPPLSERVRFTGYISDSELVELLNGAAALVFPSLWEGFGLPAVEAMSCGVPVLASNRGSLPEVVGEAGLFFDPMDIDDIVRCVGSFLGDETLRRRFSEAALQRSREFTWERAAELAEASFLRCYEDSQRG